MSKTRSTKAFNEFVLLNEVELRTVVATASEEIPFGNIGKTNASITIENDLDQQVGVVVQGKARGGTDWHTAVASANIAAGANGDAALTVPWGEVRLLVTAALLPTTGSISAWITYV